MNDYVKHEAPRTSDIMYYMYFNMNFKTTRNRQALIAALDKCRNIEMKKRDHHTLSWYNETEDNVDILTYAKLTTILNDSKINEGKIFLNLQLNF